MTCYQKKIAWAHNSQLLGSSTLNCSDSQSNKAANPSKVTCQNKSM